MLKTLSLPNFLGHKVPAKTSARILPKKYYLKPVSTFRFWVSLALGTLNFLVLMSYVAGVNNNASKGYEIKQLQTQIARLAEENEQLGLKVSEASSMVTIQTDYLSSNFVAAGSAKYLQLNQYSQR